jgi:Flp pilus assembly protein TadD
VGLELEPTRVDLIRFLGTLLLEQGRAGEAAAELRRATQLEPDSAVNHALLALSIAAAGDPRQGAELAARAAAMRGAGAPALHFAGRTMLLAAIPDSADVYLARALALTPRDPELLTVRGLARALLHDSAGAATLFREALAIRSDYAPAARGLAAMRGGRGGSRR